MTAIWEGFDQYLSDRAPTDWEKKEVRRYRERLHEILNAEFRLIAFFQSGSFQHGTAITPFSDVDYMARIHFEDRPQSSTTVLTKIREVLQANLWEARKVTVDRPAVTVDFSALVTYYEITPAFLERGTTNDDRVVLIPAAGGGWREAAPKAHNKFVAEMDSRHGGSVRDIARLMKAWKYEHAVPISSFYLEMRCAEFGKNNDTIWPLTTLRTLVGKLVSTELPAMNDPTGLVNRISPCSSDTSRRTSLSRLRELKTNLDAARDAWLGGETKRWDFNQALQAIWGPGFPYCDP